MASTVLLRLLVRQHRLVSCKALQIRVCLSVCAAESIVLFTQELRRAFLPAKAFLLIYFGRKARFSKRRFVSNRVVTSAVADLLGLISWGLDEAEYTQPTDGSYGT